MWNLGPGDVGTHNIGSFFDVFFEPLVRDCPTPVLPATWGSVKANYR
jgi:hypothetical protein